MPCTTVESGIECSTPGAGVASGVVLLRRVCEMMVDFTGDVVTRIPLELDDSGGPGIMGMFALCNSDLVRELDRSCGFLTRRGCLATNSMVG